MGLKQVQADTFALYALTHAFHWNVRGALFPELHAMFEAQYNELWNAVDTIAERIRALQMDAPNLADMVNATKISFDRKQDDGKAQVRILLSEHETCRESVKECCDDALAKNDQATANLMADRMQAHDKAMWMLRSTLGA